MSVQDNSKPIDRDHFKKALFKADRTTWAIKFLGLAHLTLALSWLIHDSTLIAKEHFFYEYSSPLVPLWQTLLPIVWLLSSILLIFTNTNVKLFRVLLLALCGLSQILNLGQLPSELLQTNDQILFMVTVFTFIQHLVPSQTIALSKGSVFYIFAFWSWLSLEAILNQPSPLWQKYQFFNFFGWSGVAPTSFAKVLVTYPYWLKQYLASLLLAGLAWGPLVLFFKIRLWPLLWLVVTPLALWIGEGQPCILGTSVWCLGAICLDERLSVSIDAYLARFVPLNYFSAYGTLRWPLLLIGLTVSLSENMGILPLLLITLYFQWSPSEKFNLNTQHAYHLLLLIPILVFSSHYLRLPKFLQDIPLIEKWSLSSSTGTWTQRSNLRYSLTFEYSEDGGANWKTEPQKANDLVSIDRLPWRPLSPLRETTWFYNQANHNECVEGPLMEYIELRLKKHIRRLNTPPLYTPHELVLFRARHFKWTRSAYTFWRKEGVGMFCIETNLPILMRARALIKQSRVAKPKMPRLAPDPRKMKKRRPAR